MNKTLRIPIKQILLEGTGKPKEKTFKFLNGIELNQLLDLMDAWYFNNLPLTKRTRKYDKVIARILDELDQDKLPARLYRGISFKTRAELTNYVKELKKDGALPYKGDFTSWSPVKSIAQRYAVTDEKKHGIVIEIPRELYKDEIYFTISPLLCSMQDKFDLINLALEHEHLKYKDSFRSMKSIDGIDFGISIGTKNAIMEDEFILTKIVAHEDIKYTLVEGSK